MAQIKQATFGAVDIDFVLGVGGYDLDRLLLIHFNQGLAYQMYYFAASKHNVGM